MIRIIVAICFACVFGGQAFASERLYVKDACVWETFEASCSSSHEVILIKKAFFGRMRSSRCFNLESGEKPCFADVQSFVERHCGGRRSCKIKLTNENLKRFPSNCTIYSQKSLEIEYSCQEVYTAEDQPCASNQSLLVTTSSGYLANIVTDETGQGSQMCPWRFVPQSGQTVHLTLLDFGVWIDTADRDRRDMCRIYATVKEIETTYRKSERVTLVCGGMEREKFIMPAESEITIAMMKQERTANDTTYFLIKYQVYDCPNFEGPALAVTERSGSGIRITCEFNSAMIWDVKCVAGNWTPRHIINCPEMTTTAPPCPEIIPPEGTTVNYTDNNRYNAVAHCSNGPSVELLCINGVWTPNQTSVCFSSPMTGTLATTGESSSSDQLNMAIIAGSVAFVALVVVVAIGATVACRKRQTEKKKMNGSLRSHSNNSYYTGQLLIDRPTNRVQSEIYETLDESRMQDVVEAPPIPCSPSCSQATERNAKTLQPNQKLEPWTDPSMLRRCDTLPVHRPLPEPNEYTTPLSRDSTYLMPREPVYLNPAVCDDAVKGQMF